MFSLTPVDFSSLSLCLCTLFVVVVVREMQGMQPVELFLEGETQTSSVSFKAGVMLHVCDQAIIIK